MLKPEAALGNIAIPLSKVLNDLKSFTDTDDASRHLMCINLTYRTNLFMLLQLCVGASDYLRWLGL